MLEVAWACSFFGVWEYSTALESSAFIILEKIFVNWRMINIENTAIETAYFAAMTHPEVTWVYSDSVGFEGEEYLWKHPFDTNQEKKENQIYK